jgi:hypothetical protein
VHHEPPEVTWPPPEPDVGVVVGELRPDELEPDELLEPEEPDDPELELDVPDVACEALAAGELAAAPGKAAATAPAPIRLAAAAEIVTARTRARPRSLAAARDATPGGAAFWSW